MNGKLRWWMFGTCVALMGIAPRAVRAAEGDGTSAAPESPMDGPYGPEINDDDPESSVPDLKGLNSDPLASGYMLMELSFRAEQAESRGDWPKALRYYKALAKAVPDRAVAYAKQCRVYMAMSQNDLAIEACRTATGLPGVKLDDFVRLANLLLERTPDGALVPAADVSELEQLVAHLREQKIEGPDPEAIECRLAIKLSNPERLRACIERLDQKLPNDPTAQAFRFSLALLQNDFSGAHGVIDQARQANLPAEAIGLMQQELSNREHARFTRRLSLGATAMGVPGLIAGLLFALSRRRRRPAPA